MKKVLFVIFSLACLNIASAEDLQTEDFFEEIVEVEREISATCEDGEASCSDLTRAQEDCVIKKRCNPEIQTLLKKKRALEKEIEDLKAQVANLEERNLYLVHHRKKVVKNESTISLFVGRTPTGLKVEESNNNFKAETKPENDAMLMWQTDIDDDNDWRFGGALSIKGNAYLGLGLNY